MFEKSKTNDIGVGDCPFFKKTRLGRICCLVDTQHFMMAILHCTFSFITLLCSVLIKVMFTLGIPR